MNDFDHMINDENPYPPYPVPLLFAMDHSGGVILRHPNT